MTYHFSRCAVKNLIYLSITLFPFSEELPNIFRGWVSNMNRSSVNESQHQHKRLEKLCEYSRQRRANESKETHDKRLQQQREYAANVRANENDTFERQTKMKNYATNSRANEIQRTECLQKQRHYANETKKQRGKRIQKQRQYARNVYAKAQYSRYEPSFSPHHLTTPLF